MNNTFQTTLRTLTRSIQTGLGVGVIALTSGCFSSEDVADLAGGDFGAGPGSYRLDAQREIRRIAGGLKVTTESHYGVLRRMLSSSMSIWTQNGVQTFCSNGGSYTISAPGRGGASAYSGDVSINIQDCRHPDARIDGVFDFFDTVVDRNSTNQLEVDIAQLVARYTLNGREYLITGEDLVFTESTQSAQLRINGSLRTELMNGESEYFASTLSGRAILFDYARSALVLRPAVPAQVSNGNATLVIEAADNADLVLTMRAPAGLPIDVYPGPSGLDLETDYFSTADAFVDGLVSSNGNQGNARFINDPVTPGADTQTAQTSFDWGRTWDDALLSLR